MKHQSINTAGNGIVLEVYDEDWDLIRERELTQHERDVYAKMIMMSLRGSFFPLKDRINLLIDVAKSGLGCFDEQHIIDKARQQFERQYADGRTWRTEYGDVEISVTDLDKDLVLDLGQTIPDDLSWDEQGVLMRY